MSEIKEGPEVPFLHALAGDLSGGIEAQEARGQGKLVASDLLPTQLLRCTAEDIEGLGIELGDVVEDDPLFRHARLPEGWSKVPTEHPMWSKVVDEDGVSRLAVFYKAAFYDRDAHMSLDQV